MEKIISCLLIDDDADDHEIFRMAISDTLLTVSCEFAFNWSDAFGALEKKAVYAPDFIFLDWFLSGIDSENNVKALKQIPKLNNSQIIIYSGSVPADMIDDLYQKYNCKFFKKTGSLSFLTGALRTMILEKYV